MSISLYVRETGKVWAIIPAKTYYGLEGARSYMLHEPGPILKPSVRYLLPSVYKYVLYNYQYEVYVNFFFQSQTMDIILYLHVLYYCISTSIRASNMV